MRIDISNEPYMYIETVYKMLCTGPYSLDGILRT